MTVHLGDLEGIVYHFRVLAVNTWGTTATSDRTFNFFPPSCPNSVLRQKTGSSYLPDCRAYELVSPGLAGNILLGAVLGSRYAQNPSLFLYIGLAGVLERHLGNQRHLLRTPMSPQGRRAGGSPNTRASIRTNTLSNWFAVGDMALDKFYQLQNGLLRRTYAVCLLQQRKLSRRWPANWDRSATHNWRYSTPPSAHFQPSSGLQPPGVVSSQDELRFRRRWGDQPLRDSAYDYDVATETTETRLQGRRRL